MAAGATRPLFHTLNANFSLTEDTQTPHIPYVDKKGVSTFSGVWYPSGRKDRRIVGLHGGHLSLARLVNIASRPHLAKHVKSLSIGLGCLWGCNRVSCSDGVPSDHDNLVPNYEVGGDESFIPAIQRYTEYLGRAVAFSLPKLGSVHAVQILGECRRWNYYTQARDLLQYLRECMKRVVQVVLTHFSHPRRKGMLREWTQTHSSVHDFGLLSETSMPQNIFCNVRTLSLTANQSVWYANENLSPNLAPGAVPLERLLSLAVMVKHLRIDRGCSGVFQTNLDLTVVSRLPLKTLYLQNIKEPSASTEASILHQADREHLEKRGIHTLGLSITTISCERLMQLLESSATTLRSIKFSSVSLTSGTWARVFTFMIEQLPALQHLRLDWLCYDLRGSSAHLAIEENDPIIPDDRSDLRSADLHEFYLLQTLYTVVSQRSDAPEKLRFPPSFHPRWTGDGRTVFGPGKRPYTILDKWLGIEAM